MSHIYQEYAHWKHSHASRHPTSHGQPIRDEIIPCLRRDRSQTDQVRLVVSSYVPYIERGEKCVGSHYYVSRMHALDTRHVSLPNRRATRCSVQGP